MLTTDITPHPWKTAVPRDRPLRIVFMGTPDFAVPTYKALSQSPHEIVRVYTQTDKPQGRGQKMQPPPIKTLALEAGIPVSQPEKMTSPEAYAQLQADQPDLAVVIAYGKILRPRILATPTLGCINCHASLLPAYRGAAPIYWAVRNGETHTGITTMLMDEGMDTGPMLLQAKLAIDPLETVGSVHNRLAELSASLLLDTIDALLAGTLVPTPQDHSKATVAPMLSNHENWIDFSQPYLEVHNKIRALDPFPGARCLYADRQSIKLFGSHPRPDLQGNPGTVVATTHDALLIACATGGVAVHEVQVAGRKRMPVQAFLTGHSFPPSTQLFSDSTPEEI